MAIAEKLRQQAHNARAHAEGAAQKGLKGIAQLHENYAANTEALALIAEQAEQAEV